MQCSCTEITCFFLKHMPCQLTDIFSQYRLNFAKGRPQFNLNSNANSKKKTFQVHINMEYQVVLSNIMIDVFFSSEIKEVRFIFL